MTRSLLMMVHRSVRCVRPWKIHDTWSMDFFRRSAKRNLIRLRRSRPNLDDAEGSRLPAMLRLPRPCACGVLLSVESSSEPPDRIEAVRKVAEAAAFLRRREPEVQLLI